MFEVGGGSDDVWDGVDVNFCGGFVVGNFWVC